MLSNAGEVAIDGHLKVQLNREAKAIRLIMSEESSVVEMDPAGACKLANSLLTAAKELTSPPGQWAGTLDVYTDRDKGMVLVALDDGRVVGFTPDQVDSLTFALADCATFLRQQKQGDTSTDTTEPTPGA